MSEYALQAKAVIAGYYGTDTPSGTYEPAIGIPDDETVVDLKRRNKIGKQKRTIYIMYSDWSKQSPNWWLHQYDLWQDNKNIVGEATITTCATLPLDEYKLLLAAALWEQRWKIHGVIEDINVSIVEEKA